MVLIELKALEVRPRLAPLSFEAGAGEVIGVIGPNGAGKSTLLNAIAGLLKRTGQCLFEGTDLATLPARQRAQRLGVLPQFTDSAWPLTVETIVALGRLPWGDTNTRAVNQAMQATGISHLHGKRIDQLSGGERARVWLARVLAGEPRVLIADEPTASLDLFYQRTVMDCVRTYADNGNLVIIAIHDLALAAGYCDRLVLLQDGHCHAQGQPHQVLTDATLSQVFGVPVHVDLTTSPPVIAVHYTPFVS